MCTEFEFHYCYVLPRVYFVGNIDPDETYLITGNTFVMSIETFRRSLKKKQLKQFLNLVFNGHKVVFFFITTTRVPFRRSEIKLIKVETRHTFRRLTALRKSRVEESLHSVSTFRFWMPWVTKSKNNIPWFGKYSTCYVALKMETVWGFRTFCLIFRRAFVMYTLNSQMFLFGNELTAFYFAENAFYRLHLNRVVLFIFRILIMWNWCILKKKHATGTFIDTIP